MNRTPTFRAAWDDEMLAALGLEEVFDQETDESLDDLNKEMQAFHQACADQFQRTLLDAFAMPADLAGWSTAEVAFFEGWKKCVAEPNNLPSWHDEVAALLQPFETEGDA